MKVIFTIVLVGLVLYFGKETETHLEIINSPNKRQSLSENKVETPPLLDMRYQHGRVLGESLAIVGHDVFESQFVYLRLPLSAQTGDTLILSGSQFQYQCATNYEFVNVFVVIEAHEQGASDKLVGVLHCWLIDDNHDFKALERRIDVVF